MEQTLGKAKENLNSIYNSLNDGSQKKWVIKSENEILKNIFVKQLNISGILAQLLINRGIYTVEDAEFFLCGTLNDLYNPLLMMDMKEAVDIIVSAIKDKSPILIYGDYDVDGVTSTALMVSAIESVGGTVDYYIPNRTNGYGLNSDAIRDAVKKGFAFIISVDCGITAVEEAEIANKLGIRLIITDHHEPSDALPRADAVINPKRKDCRYPFKELAGVGVVWKVIQALYQRMNLPSSAWYNFLDLVCLGTIADIVPLLGENRIIAKYGLEKLTRTNNLGIIALKEVSGLSGKLIRERDVGFVLSPRINAAGRLDDANIAVKLLLSAQPEQAREIALTLDTNNKERQFIEQQVLDEAVKMIKRENLLRDKVLVLASDKWHAGVIGIVASRLLSRYNRPVLLISVDGKEAKGSARSMEGFQLYEALSQCRDYLEKFGGHEKAAGFSLDVNQIENLRKKINEYADKVISDEDLMPIIKIDKIIDLDDLNEKIVDEINSLSPFGEKNPTPVLAAKDVSVLDVKTVGNGNKHLKMKLRGGKKVLDSIGFRLADMINAVKFDSDKVNIVFFPTLNHWNGEQSVQLEIKHVCNRTQELSMRNPNVCDECAFNPFSDFGILTSGFCYIPEYILQKINSYRQNSAVIEDDILADDKDEHLSFLNMVGDVYNDTILYDYRECTDRMQLLTDMINNTMNDRKIIVLVDSDYKVLELANALTLKNKQLTKIVFYYNKTMPEYAKEELCEVFNNANDKNTIITTPMLLKDINFHNIDEAIFYDVPFNYDSMKTVADLMNANSKWYFLFSAKDVGKSLAVLKKFMPERNKLVVLYKYLMSTKKAYMEIAAESMIKLLEKYALKECMPGVNVPKVRVNNYTLALCMKILAELKLLKFQFKDGIYRIKMMDKPNLKLKLDNSKTFRWAAGIITESSRFMSLLTCENLDRFFKTVVRDEF